jgi:hypothetical protein
MGRFSEQKGRKPSMLASIMYEQYAFQPQSRPRELEHAIEIVRPFLRERQPNLHAAVQQAALTRACGRVAVHPQMITTETLRHDEDATRLCAVLTSPWAEVALAVLAFEFPMPGMRLLIELLPPAARALCAERQRNDATALGLGALGLGLLILRALSNRPKQPPAQ